ncbi:MAG: hypothetical protein WC732_08655 [Candidatus Omnitrophota bacterium]
MDDERIVISSTAMMTALYDTYMAVRYCTALRAIGRWLLSIARVHEHRSESALVEELDPTMARPYSGMLIQLGGSPARLQKIMTPLGTVFPCTVLFGDRAHEQMLAHAIMRTERVISLEYVTGSAVSRYVDGTVLLRVRRVHGIDLPEFDGCPAIIEPAPLDTVTYRLYRRVKRHLTSADGNEDERMAPNPQCWYDVPQAYLSVARALTMMLDCVRKCLGALDAPSRTCIPPFAPDGSRCRTTGCVYVRITRAGDALMITDLWTPLGGQPLFPRQGPWAKIDAALCRKFVDAIDWSVCDVSATALVASAPGSTLVPFAETPGNAELRRSGFVVALLQVRRVGPYELPNGDASPIVYERPVPEPGERLFHGHLVHKLRCMCIQK